MVDATGRSLYTFDKDAPGATTSSCSGACATRWPLLTVTGTPSAAPDVPGTLSTAFASGAGSAVAWQGRLLYYFSGDHAPGDTNGDGVGGTWHLVKPAADAGGSSMTVVGGY